MGLKKLFGLFQNKDKQPVQGNTYSQLSIDAFGEEQYRALRRLNKHPVNIPFDGLLGLQVDTIPFANKCLELGLLRFATIEERLNNLTVPILKEVLKENGLSTAGRKAELIDRLLSNIPQQDLNSDSRIIPIYLHTDKARQVIGDSYEILHKRELEQFHILYQLVKQDALETAIQRVGLHSDAIWQRELLKQKGHTDLSICEAIANITGEPYHKVLRRYQDLFGKSAVDEYAHEIGIDLATEDFNSAQNSLPWAKNGGYENDVIWAVLEKQKMKYISFQNWFELYRVFKNKYTLLYKENRIEQAVDNLLAAIYAFENETLMPFPICDRDAYGKTTLKYTSREDQYKVAILYWQKNLIEERNGLALSRADKEFLQAHKSMIDENSLEVVSLHLALKPSMPLELFWSGLWDSLK